MSELGPGRKRRIDIWAHFTYDRPSANCVEQEHHQIEGIFTERERERKRERDVIFSVDTN